MFELSVSFELEASDELLTVSREVTELMPENSLVGCGASIGLYPIERDIQFEFFSRELARNHQAKFLAWAKKNGRENVTVGVQEVSEN